MKPMKRIIKFGTAASHSATRNEGSSTCMSIETEGMHRKTESELIFGNTLKKTVTLAR
jgi:hypothetical protein